ncbi:glutamine synthetase family protein [Chromobacterium sp. IIBBL 290-4]|uniref:glutamine synthetase family protein n=1 Tax=Chromobacterium sp. IIBBL 290-4 TaxID=2953890 RepID=UPI0020B66DD9|nr:glutamine synthetase family protein [Chromobacterium sp. IIBBL 290-4]UTH75518.1 glutamine synthetase family protein [Chromobacterium sp. IIBBL 290-4]
MSDARMPAGRIEWLQQRKVRDVELAFADVHGFPRGKTLPAAAFIQGQALRIARAVPLQSCVGEFPDYSFYGEHDPDVTLAPDYATLRPVPWAKTPRAMVICDCVDHDGSLSPLAPRSVLKTLLQRYAARGWTPIVAPELEFYLFAAHGDPAAPFQAPPLAGGRREAGFDAFGFSALGELEAFFDDLYLACEQLEIATDTCVHEMGPSQFEINLKHGDALKLADDTFLFKTALKQTALRHGLNAVCMAKPLPGQPGSSMHLHQSIVDRQGRNAFSREDGSESPAFFGFIAGLQRYLPELMPLFCPNPNSYRRFVKGMAAPVNLSWGLDNRSVGLRVPVSGPEARRVENRLPGCDANPYLALAASLGAGLAGIEQGLTPDEAVRGNVFKQQSASLPSTLDAACGAMQAGAAAESLFGAEFSRAYLAVKEVELNDYHRQVTTWERQYLGPLA